MAMINRNPFAREELHRECVRAPGKSCDWCGQFRRGKQASTHKLFRYRTETDGGRKHEHHGLFCCKSCHDSFHY